MKCKRKNDARSIDHQSLQVMRQQAVSAAKSGIHVSKIAANLEINVRSVYRWLANYADGGQDALLAKKIPGRPPKVSSEQLNWLRNVMIHNTPIQFEFDFSLWTLGSIREVIKKEFGITLSLSSLSRVMRQIGFPVQQPQLHAYQPLPEMMNECDGEIYPDIRKSAKAAGAEIYFANKTEMCIDHSKKVKAKASKCTDNKENPSITMISAVSQSGQFRFSLVEQNINSDVFMDFLERLMYGAKKPVYLIVDENNVYRSDRRNKYLKDHRDMFKMFLLPTHYQQLNVIGQTGKIVKRRTLKSTAQARDKIKRIFLWRSENIKKQPRLLSIS